MKQIYLDNAATTKVHPEVLEAMLPYFTQEYGNASSSHLKGTRAKKALDQSRQKVAEILNCEPQEIIFCSSASEANNLAIFGLPQPGKIISSNIEHSSIHTPLQYLAKQGQAIQLLQVDQSGKINLQELQKSIDHQTKLVSIIFANNEIGTIQQIEEIGRICQQKKVLFHSDACQAASEFDLNVKKYQYNLMSINGSKIYGPKGIGILYKQKDINLTPLVYGGTQEFNLRAGTENIPAIVGFAKALELTTKNRQQKITKIRNLRNQFLQFLLQNIPGAKLNAPLENRLANNINILIPKIASSELLEKLSQQGLYLSAGSACNSKELSPSRVLKAIGLNKLQCGSSLRISLGTFNDQAQITSAQDIFLKSYQDLLKNKFKAL